MTGHVTGHAAGQVTGHAAGFSVRGTILQAPTPWALEVLEDHVVTVDDGGIITAVRPALTPALTPVSTPGAPGAPGAGDDSRPHLTLDANQVLMPGLIDTHLHAPQWPQRGAALDLPLEQWLMEHTFPLEARYADTDFARAVYEEMVPTLLAAGTTTAVYFSSVHEAATLELARICSKLGQRAFVGRVAMDLPGGTAPWYRDENASEAIAASRRSIDDILALGDALVQPIITPRFIPACSDETLAGLGALAEESGVRIQSHCSESDWEHGNVLERFGVTDTQALASFGLLRDRTLLAHGGHITDADRTVLIDAGAGIAHCPLSNSYFGDAVFPARRHLEAGLRIGLGSDIAGGSELSMLRQCGHAVTSSRMLESGVDPATAAASRGVPSSRLDATAAFHLATAGGAELLGINAGVLAPGRVFDAIAITTAGTAGTEADSGPRGGSKTNARADQWSATFEKLVRTSVPSDITRVWVQGRPVVSPDNQETVGNRF